MAQPHILAFFVGLPLMSCASTGAAPLRVVDCTQGAYCDVVVETQGSSWSKKDESLYWQGVTSILQEMACGRTLPRGRRVAYVAQDGLSPSSMSCASGRGQVRRVKDRDDANRLLAKGAIDYVVEFERSNASTVRDGVQVPVSASYYGKPRRFDTDPRLEAVDTYVIVKTDKMAEVRLVSRAAL